MLKTKEVLKWRNRYSGEEGYVKTVSRAKGYFTSTFNPAEAKSYRSQKEVEKDLAFLYEIGEMLSNDFFTVKISIAV